MVAIETIRAANAAISKTYPLGLVAVFVGATAGIGEAAVKEFAKHAKSPRVYIVGRNKTSAERIIDECKTLNRSGTFNFLQEDMSLLRNVDHLSNAIKSKEKHINLLVMSAGFPDLYRTKTEEGLHLLVALTYYTRIRLASTLLPLLTSPASAPLRRVVNIAGGTFEGPLDATDFGTWRVPFTQLRGHLCTMNTLTLEALQKRAPSVSFVHVYPGHVATGLWDNVSGFKARAAGWMAWLSSWWDPNVIGIEECGERMAWLTTATSFAPVEGKSGKRGEKAAVATTGREGDGVYSVDTFGDIAGNTVVELLKGYRDEGMVEKLWEHNESEWKRILGA